jgi:hypothetical protein
MKNKIYIYLLFLTFVGVGYSQGKFNIQSNNKPDKIPFELINNLIIIPVEINDVKLSFILDTGVGKAIIFNYLDISDSLKIKDTQPIYLRGLGEGDSVEALKSKNNVFRIGETVNFNQDLFAVFDKKINFAPRLGIPVHGIIGYDLFKDLVVEINYTSKFIRLTEHGSYKYKKCNKCETVNLEFYNNKPYLDAQVKIEGKKIPIKLLIDSGGSDSLWLFEDEALGISHSDKYFVDFLGHGLSGSVYGKRSIIEEFSINGFVLKNANVAFPDDSSILFAKQFADRNGTIAGNILKRFNLIVDYKSKTLSLKKNSFFKQEFSYNKSGIELAHNGVMFVKEVDYKRKNNTNLVDNTSKTYKISFESSYKFSLKPSYAIVEIRKNSPAANVGLLPGDLVLSINGKSAYQYSLQDLMYKFYDKAGTRIKLSVERNGVIFDVVFKLEKLFL